MEGSAKGWVRKLVGILVRILSVVFLALVASFFGLLILLLATELTVPSSLVNGVGNRVASRFGVGFSIDSLRIGGLPLICNGRIELLGVNVREEGADGLAVKLDRLHFADGDLLSVEGLRVATADQPPALVVEKAEWDFEARELQVTAIQIEDSWGEVSTTVGTFTVSTETWSTVVEALAVASEPEDAGFTARVARISTSPLIEAQAPEGWLRVEEVTLSEVGLGIPARPSPDEAPQQSPETLCERTQSQLSTINEVRARLITLPDELAAGIARLRHIFTWVLAAAIAFFLLLKLLTILWIRHRSRLLLLLLPAATVLLPVLLFLTLGRAVSFCTLFFASAGASLAMAAVLRWRVYTRESGAGEWYHRWNPFAADAAAFVLVTFLLVRGFAVSLLALPSGLYVDRLTVADSSLHLQIDRCGEPIHVQLEAPQAEVSGVEVPLPTGSGARLDFAIARIEIPTSSISLASGSEGNEELALLAVTDTTADDVHVGVDIEEARVEDVRAGLRLSGDLESKSLREDLQRVRFPRIFNLMFYIPTFQRPSASLFIGARAR